MHFTGVPCKNVLRFPLMAHMTRKVGLQNTFLFQQCQPFSEDTEKVLSCDFVPTIATPLWCCDGLIPACHIMSEVRGELSSLHTHTGCGKRWGWLIDSAHPSWFSTELSGAWGEELPLRAWLTVIYVFTYGWSRKSNPLPWCYKCHALPTALQSTIVINVIKPLSAIVVPKSCDKPSHF